jgi:tryptophanyl-tRNA synthetase
MAAKKRLFTGLQPSGQLHIGNYFGALKPFADMYEEYDSMLMIADYHTLTSLKNPTELRQNIIEITRAYIAAGVDPEKATIFKQSDVPEHTELAWIFETLVTVPFLMQAHAYKDKVAKGLEANAGLFNYPMLMAADILLYDTDVVPVGADQRQHVEYSREAANKFNNAFGQTFTEPAEKILDTVAIVPGVDGEKMSKSYKNTIPLFGSKEEIQKAVMSIVTDSGDGTPIKETVPNKITGAVRVFQIHTLFKDQTELTPFYIENKNNYKAIKERLVEDIEAFVKPMREKYESITEDEVKRVLARGAEKARAVAAEKMRDVRAKVGVSL